MLNELSLGKNSSFGDFSTYAFIKEENFLVPASVAQRLRRDAWAAPSFEARRRVRSAGRGLDTRAPLNEGGSGIGAR
jgi:hypothetical protein